MYTYKYIYAYIMHIHLYMHGCTCTSIHVYTYIYIYIYIYAVIHKDMHAKHKCTHTHQQQQTTHTYTSTHTDKPMQLKRCNLQFRRCIHHPSPLAATVFDFSIICFKEMQPQRCNYGEHMKHISCMMFAASDGEEGRFATEEMQPAIAEMQPRFLISILFVLKRCNHRDATNT